MKSSRGLGQNIVPLIPLKIIKRNRYRSFCPDASMCYYILSGAAQVPKSFRCVWSTLLTGVKWVMSPIPSKEARTCFAAWVVLLSTVIVAFKKSLIHLNFTLIASKVGEKCFWSRKMELQGLQEALKVEIQCHQVNETSCYSILIGLISKWER